MRSRNGNCPVILPSLALISTLSFGAEHYYIGYRLTTNNAQPISEELTLSKAMKPCSTIIVSSLTLIRLPRESLEALLERQRSEFLEYAGTFRLKSDQRLQNSQIKSLQTLTLPTKCYAVEFNDDFVTISTLK